MTAIIITAAWLATTVLALAVGFRLGKHAPYTRTLGEELARRTRVGGTYARATVAVLIPAYGRRWKRQRIERQRAYEASLPIIESSHWD